MTTNFESVLLALTVSDTSVIIYLLRATYYFLLTVSDVSVMITLKPLAEQAAPSKLVSSVQY